MASLVVRLEYHREIVAIEDVAAIAFDIGQIVLNDSAPRLHGYPDIKAVAHVRPQRAEQRRRVRLCDLYIAERDFSRSVAPSLFSHLIDRIPVSHQIC